MKNIILLLILSLTINCSAQQYTIKTGDNPTEKTPWTSLKVNDCDEKFQFAIVADFTGGPRTEVCRQAIRNLNMLQPDFVLSVGDLIDGYTTNDKYLSGQWQEFEDIIDELEMPFFRLPGNHDLSNDWMREEWKKRYGRSYYYFRYKNVLFLCLNTEDSTHAAINQKQVDYFEEIIQKNSDVYHTIICMHVPIWNHENMNGFEKIEALLKDRPYTIYSGHYHNFFKNRDSKGNEKYVLATTGGSSSLRGKEYGEFDHITWVTMDGGRPTTVNLALDGIVSDEIVNEENSRRIYLLRMGHWFNIEPIVNSTDSFKELEMKILYDNSSEFPLIVSGKLPTIPGITFSSEKINQIIKPKSKFVEMIKIINSGETRISKLENEDIKVELHGAFVIEDTLSLPSSKKLTLDWKHLCKKSEKSINVDCDFSDWDDKSFIYCKNPGYIKEDWAWNGKSDGWYKFATTFDDEFFYVAIETFDDKLLLSNGKLLEFQDKLLINISSNIKVSENSQIQIEFAPDKKKGSLVKSSIEGLKIQCHKAEKGISAELAIPLKAISDENIELLRFNISFMDHDRLMNTKPSQLWWRPIWGSDLDYKNSGVFEFVK